MPDSDAEAIIILLNLQPHPEGGHFRETFRDEDEDKAHSTAIYFLLKAGEKSRWHRVHGSTELWHHYAGAPLELLVSRAGEKPARMVLGSDLAGGERPQGVVPAGCWQSARSLGDWSLVGCTVAPGFSFENFELADKDWEPAK